MQSDSLVNDDGLMSESKASVTVFFKTFVVCCNLPEIKVLAVRFGDESVVVVKSCIRFKFMKI
jgi:hypothetical protein